MYRQETDSAAGEKKSSNKRLVSQRGERTCLQVANFGDDLIERLPFRFAFPTQRAEPRQSIEPSCTQCLRHGSEQDCTAQRLRGSDCADQEETIIKKGRAGDDQQCENEKWVPDQRRHHLRALCDEKNLVIRGQLLISQWRTAVGSFNNAATPFRYFPAKHADEIAVHLNGIGDVKGEKQQTRSRQKRDNPVELKRNITASRGRGRRKKLVDGEREQKVQSKKNSDPNKARPKFIPAKISVPCFLCGKARSFQIFPHLPVFEPEAKIPPSKSRQRQWSKGKFCLDLPLISTEIDTGFEHEKDRKHECDHVQHFTCPDADPGGKCQRFLRSAVLRNQSHHENNERPDVDQPNGRTNERAF